MPVRADPAAVAEQTPPAAAPSWGCAGCGGCCQRIRIHGSPAELEARAASSLRRLEHVRGVAEATGAPAAPAYLADLQAQADEDRFFVERWTLIGYAVDDNAAPNVYSCSAYDPVGRTCTAHENRPRTCSLYPFYGPVPETGTNGGGTPWWSTLPGVDQIPGCTGEGELEDPLGCSYRWDLPAGERGPVVGRLLPLWPVEAARP